MPERSLNMFDNARIKRIRRSLLRWYDRHARDLPWRAKAPATPNPYHVLVSEAMLQQTQVATVLPYFLRFIKTYPTVRNLAGAGEQDVLRLWQGLGYYRRALNLHKAAEQICRYHNGRLPDSFEAILNLPGVGRYTAGAIASIAFNQSYPILDGNVMRVLSRLFTVTKPITTKAVQDELWSLARMLVPSSRGRPGDFNQAMMELGALICTKVDPKCSCCPLCRCCLAVDTDVVAELPVKSTRTMPILVHHYVAAVQCGGKFLFQKRPASGLWAGMWELPTMEVDRQLKRLVIFNNWLHDRLALVAECIKPVGQFKHQTTHRTIQFHVYHIYVNQSSGMTMTRKWRQLRQITDLPMSNPQRKVVKLLNEKANVSQQ